MGIHQGFHGSGYLADLSHENHINLVHLTSATDFLVDSQQTRQLGIAGMNQQGMKGSLILAVGGDHG
jgi:hypothetical protein